MEPWTQAEARGGQRVDTPMAEREEHKHEGQESAVQRGR